MALGAGCAWLPPVQTAALRRAAEAPGSPQTPQTPESAASRSAQPAPAERALPWGSVPLRADLARVPFHPQTTHHCGPAVLASLLGAAGLPGTPEGLVPQTYVPAREGSLQIEMLAAARRQGGLAVVLPARLEALITEVGAGRPVGVLLNLGLSWWPQWHYATLVGYDLPAEDLRLHSGAQPRERWSMATFEHTWTRAQAWAFVVTRPGDLPVSARQEAVESATLALERLALPAPMRAAWEAVLARWPHSLLGAMGAGNACYALERWAEAARHFEAAAQRHDRAAAHNNLALARWRLGDLPGARAAAAAALARARSAEPALLDAVRDTLARLPAP